METVTVTHPETDEEIEVPIENKFGRELIKFDRIYLWEDGAIIAEKYEKDEAEAWELIIETNGTRRQNHITNASDVDPAMEILWER